MPTLSSLSTSRCCSSQWIPLLCRFFLPKNTFYRRRTNLFFLAVICFAASIPAGFVFDDFEAIVHNSDVRWTLASGQSWWQFLQNDFWGRPITSNQSHKSWRPLTTLSFRLNYLWRQDEPQGYHLINVLLHGVVTVLSYDFYVEMLSACGARDCRFEQLSFLSSVIFACHPVHAEAVSSIVGRAELLSAFCFLLAFLAYAKSLKYVHLWHSIKSILLCFILSTFALAAKEQGITILILCMVYDVFVCSGPKVVACYDYMRCSNEAESDNNNNNNNVSDKKEMPVNVILTTLFRLSFLFISLISLLFLRMHVMAWTKPQFTAADNPAAFHSDKFFRVINYLYLWMFNFWILVNPSALCFDYSMGCIPLITTMSDYRLWFTILSTLGVVFAGIVLLKRITKLDSFDFKKQLLYFSCILSSLMALVIPFLPASNVLVSVGFVIAERVLYIPSLGYCLLIAYAFMKTVIEKPKLSNWAKKLFWLMIIMFTLKSIMRSIQWQNEYTLYFSGLSVCPNNAKVHYNLAKVYADDGNKDKAYNHYLKSIILKPDYEQALNNLANILKDDKRLAEAEYLLDKAVIVNPTFVTAWMNLGVVKAALQKNEEAERCYLKALHLRPNYADCLYNLGNLYAHLNRINEARQCWKNATRVRRWHSKAWSNLMILETSVNQCNEAVRIGLEALQYIPQDSSIHFNVATCYGQSGEFSKAEKHFKIALTGDPLNPTYYANMGILYHRWKRYSSAEKMYRQALLLNSSLSSVQLYLRRLRVEMKNSKSEDDA
ncbi:Transmembrane and TPR repeat-containing protein 4 [Trichinella zimbabwensis]|uniref:dolichyl-phosphate-mannose--protein mannosyltransferase n=1 Tax=Trichinella zimbabwensis TaxID=268475 RepID=A0A0V1HXD8_9BILA|nr:Transmembrane and TPR repeat-containing protein 4 [Trichinella zimbabwensis]